MITRTAAAAAALEAAKARFAEMREAARKGGPDVPSMYELILAEYAVGDAESALWLAQCAETEE